MISGLRQLIALLDILRPKRLDHQPARAREPTRVSSSPDFNLAHALRLKHSWLLESRERGEALAGRRGKTSTTRCQVPGTSGISPGEGTSAGAARPLDGPSDPISERGWQGDYIKNLRVNLAQRMGWRALDTVIN